MSDADGTPGEPAPRVLIADDQTLVRTGFRMILRDAGIPVVAEAADGAHAVAAALEHQPDVVLMDIRMPEMDGLEATRRILDRHPGTDCRIIMLTTFDLDQYVYGALAAGRQRLPAQARLTRVPHRRDPHGPLRRRPARPLHHPSARRTVRLPDLRSRALCAANCPTSPPANWTCCGCWPAGLSNAEIAAQLTLSDATVKTHVARLLAKLQLRDRIQAVILAYETGLVSPGAT